MNLRIDSPWIQTGIRITNILILNFWLVIGCLPVFTIGTSLIAAFSVALKMADDRDESSITRMFWRAWIENLGHGMILTLLSAVVAWCIWMNFQLFTVLESAPLMALLCGIIGCLLLYIHLLYAFALEARYENSVWASLINSRKICLRFFLQTLALSGILLIQVLLFTQTAGFMTYIGLFCAPALMVYTIAKMALSLFAKIEKDAMASDGFSVAGV